MPKEKNGNCIKAPKQPAKAVFACLCFFNQQDKGPLPRQKRRWRPGTCLRMQQNRQRCVCPSAQRPNNRRCHLRVAPYSTINPLRSRGLTISPEPERALPPLEPPARQIIPYRQKTPPEDISGGVLRGQISDQAPGTSLPGFIRPLGSMACLIACMMAMVSTPCSASIKASLP